MKRTVSRKGNGTIMTLTSINAKIEAKGTKKYTTFRFLSPATTDTMVIRLNVRTQIIDSLLL